MTADATLTDTSRFQRWVRPDHVLLQRIQDEWVVLNLKTETYLSLNAVAVRMWDVLLESPSFEAAIERLAAEFEVERDRLETDFLGLVTDLQARGLLEVASRQG